MRALAIDLGAGSGRAIVGAWDGACMTLTEAHRFSNHALHLGQRLHWDFPYLLREVTQGIARATADGPLQSFGIDSWAVDFGLLDAAGELMGLPYHYRDRQTAGMRAQVSRRISPDALYARTGIQYLPFNTIYQLTALTLLRPDWLKAARQFLMMPNLLAYFLTGARYAERTNASTTQLFNPLTGDWDTGLIEQLGFARSWFPALLEPGAVAGRLTEGVATQISCERLPLVAVGEHDTASAVAAVPAVAKDGEWAYLSSGTWSLLGLELQTPLLTAAAHQANVTNEAGVGGTTRLLKNVMGLWILQECARQWSAQQKEIVTVAHVVAQVNAQAAHSPSFTTLIAPDDERFLAPVDMVAEICAYARETGQPIPETRAAVARAVLESLALRYAYVLAELEQLTGRRVRRLHVVGGGANNALLCQWTANAIGRPVWAGPVEATAVGNLLAQWIAAGEIADLTQGREIVRRSFAVTVYEPSEPEVWLARANGAHWHHTKGC